MKKIFWLFLFFTIFFYNTPISLAKQPESACTEASTPTIGEIARSAKVVLITETTGAKSNDPFKDTSNISVDQMQFLYETQVKEVVKGTPSKQIYSVSQEDSLIKDPLGFGVLIVPSRSEYLQIIESYDQKNKRFDLACGQSNFNIIDGKITYLNRSISLTMFKLLMYARLELLPVHLLFLTLDVAVFIFFKKRIKKILRARKA